MAGARKKSISYEAWRPDFRDTNSLPDLKIVRTHFLLNLLAAFALLLASGVMVYQEYLISVQSASNQERDSEVSLLAATDRTNSMQSARFMREIQKVQEVAVFQNQPVSCVQLVAGLARVQPEQCQYDSLDIRRRTLDADKKEKRTECVVTIRGLMNPSATSSAPQMIDSFVSDISKAEFVKNCDAEVELVSSGRSQDMDYFDFVIEIRFEFIATEGIQ